ncbi:MAG: hypothetical protein R3B72_04640 [Polyangiaceae bacterium]
MIPRVAMIGRGLLPIAFFLLGAKLDEPRVIAVALPVAILAFVVGRILVVPGATRRPLGEDITPWGEAGMLAGAAGLAIFLTGSVTERLSFGPSWGATAVVLVAAWVVVALIAPRLDRGAPLPTPRRRLVATLGMIGELALLTVLLAVASEAHRATLAGPITGMQLLLSPTPALLGLACGLVPMLRLTLVEEDRRQALEAVAVGVTGVLLVGLGGTLAWA